MLGSQFFVLVESGHSSLKCCFPNSSIPYHISDGNELKSVPMTIGISNNNRRSILPQNVLSNKSEKMKLHEIRSDERNMCYDNNQNIGKNEAHIIVIFFHKRLSKSQNRNV